MKRTAITLIALCLLACAAGCGKKAPTPADTAPFQAAIADYLAGKSMGMQVAEFSSLEVGADTATAVCKMEVADDLYGGLAVRWRFTFARGADGAWRVTAHQKL